MKQTLGTLLLATSLVSCGGFPKTSSTAPASLARGRAPDAFHYEGPTLSERLLGAQTSTAASTDGRKLVRDAAVTFEIDDDEKDRTRIALGVQAIAQRLGGYVASEQTYGITLRVPTERLEDTLLFLGELGTISEKSTSVVEVTVEHTDLNIRIENARRLRTRLQALLQNANKVSEILDIEKELARVTQELELLEGRLRVLSHQIAFSTIQIQFEDHVRPGPIGWVLYGVYSGVKWLFVWD